ncbi:efflux RND transporter permease subunit [Azotosporobacter soli]|uniref:efflux RND transporter permease subunit n=1 Tax=Azotosporobacter soli TaxID=3055040 RepID=UPI0031FE63B6
MNLTSISLKRPVFATVIILALVVLGLFSYHSLDVDEYPNVEIPVVGITVKYNGASPEQIESKVTKKVEEAVSSVSGVDHISSTITEGQSLTIVEFTLETSPATAAQDVRDKIGSVVGELPTDSETPVISRFDPSATPIISLTLTGDQSLRELTTLVNDVISKRLETVGGVASVKIKGATEREIKINLDRDKIAAYKLTIPQIKSSLSSENIDTPGGKVTDGKHETTVRSVGAITDPKQFLALPIAQRNGVQLYVSNIASVEDGTVDATEITKLNDQEAIGIEVMKQSGGNTVAVAKNVKKEVEKIKKDLPAGVELKVIRDNSVTISDSINDVLLNIIIGGVLAVGIVFLFLGNWRSTLIAAIAIPTSIITTFLAMKALNFTLNTMSLLGLSLAVGILIDDAIVVIENIVRHLQMGKEKYTAAAEGTSEISLAITATTFSLVAVFLPVGMMTGVIGQFLKQFGITVAVSVLVSLFVAFTLTPMLSANYLNRRPERGQSWFDEKWNRWDAILERWTKKYGEWLALCLEHRKKVMLLVALLLLGSLSLTPLLGTGFMPDSDSAEITIAADVDAGMSPQSAGAIADQISSIARELPEVLLTYSVAQSDSLSILVKLTPKGQRKATDAQIVSLLREKLRDIPAAQISVSKKSGMSEGKPISLVIQGESLSTLVDLADQVEGIVAGVPGAVDVSSSYQTGKPDAQLVTNREKAAALGVSTSNIATTLSTMFTGTVINQYKDDNDSFDVRLILAPEDRKTLSAVDSIYLGSSYNDSSGETVMVPLSQVTNTVYSTSPTSINRYDRLDQITISANLRNVSLGDFNTALDKKLAQVALPTGYKFVTTGESQRMGDAFSGVVLALSMAVLFIFFVLAAQFESYVDPFSIMLALPLAIIGAIVGLLLGHSSLNMMSLIGIIMLMGLVTKNAILLLDFAKQQIEQGVARNQALIEAAVVRLRPIMMTTVAMIAGMLPLAFGVGPGAESRSPMAHAIIGGLITSTLLTLVVVPIMYTFLDDLRQRIYKKSGKV